MYISSCASEDGERRPCREMSRVFCFSVLPSQPGLRAPITKADPLHSMCFTLHELQVKLWHELVRLRHTYNTYSQLC